MTARTIRTSTEGDDYWDYMFQAGNHTTNLTLPTNAYNCYAYALDAFIDNSTSGAFYCWIDSGPAYDAFEADAESIAKDNVQACDVLLYGKDLGPFRVLTHATGVDNIDPVANKPNALQWKYAASGLYYMDRTTFETPMCDDVTHTVGQPLGGNWDWDEAGDESDLYPKDEVWTPE
ncbi:MAG: hypothetical protein ACYTBJ_18825 [Planctomycetota bacterium]|jgi:hypothetical protein